MTEELKIERPEDIARLPWAGNFGDDAALFELCADYYRSEPDLVKRQRGAELESLHGCGEPCTVVGTDYDPRSEKSPLTEIGLKHIAESMRERRARGEIPAREHMREWALSKR